MRYLKSLSILLVFALFAIPAQGQSSLHGTFSWSGQLNENPDPALGVTYNYAPNNIGISASAAYAGARQSLHAGPTIALTQSAHAVFEIGATRAEEHVGIGFPSHTSYPVSATVGVRFEVAERSFLVGTQYVSQYDVASGFGTVEYPRGARIMIGVGSLF